MSERPTPEVDALQFPYGKQHYAVDVKLARRLERERDYWKEQSRKWCDDFTKLEPELRRVVELAKQCKTERDEAREALRALIDDLDLRAELHAKLRGKDEVIVPVSDGILQRARAILEANP